jgi:very-short-patch-repair endonuclease
MVNIAAVVHELGGVAQKQQLVARGARDCDLTRAVRRGEIIRVRKGWYTTLSADGPEVRAVRVGGRLTGLSAIVSAGGWVLDSHTLHVSVPGNASRLRSPRNRFASFVAGTRRAVRVHWDRLAVGQSGNATSVGLLDALERVVLDEPLEVAVAALDWALHTRHLDPTDFESLVARLPATKQSIRDWVDATCESLPESLARTRLRLTGHQVVTQCRVGNNQRIDLVIDNIVAFETDGEEFHRDRFYADRAKDLAMTIGGFHALRATATMVFRDWDRVVLAIDSALRGRGWVPPEPMSRSRGPAHSCPEIGGRRRVPRLRPG